MSAVPIQDRPDWPLIISGAVLLCVHAGFVNSVGLFSLGAAVSHMTGHYTGVGLLLEQGRVIDSLIVFGLLVSFCSGAATSGMVIGQSKFIAVQPYGKMMLLVSFIEVASTLLFYWFDEHNRVLLYPLAYAMGVQNAMCTTWSGAVVRTTHFTGMITDTGIVIGHWLRYRLGLKEDWEPEQTDLWKLMLFLPMMIGFMIGGFLGTFCFNFWDFWALLIPGIGIGICGMAYRMLKRESKYFAFLRYRESLKRKLADIEQHDQEKEKAPLLSFKIGRMKEEFKTDNKAKSKADVVISMSSEEEDPENAVMEEFVSRQNEEGFLVELEDLVEKAKAEDTGL